MKNDARFGFNINPFLDLGFKKCTVLLTIALQSTITQSPSTLTVTSTCIPPNQFTVIDGVTQTTPCTGGGGAAAAFRRRTSEIEMKASEDETEIIPSMVNKYKHFLSLHLASSVLNMHF